MHKYYSLFGDRGRSFVTFLFYLATNLVTGDGPLSPFYSTLPPRYCLKIFNLSKILEALIGLFHFCNP